MAATRRPCHRLLIAMTRLPTAAPTTCRDSCSTVTCQRGRAPRLGLGLGCHVAHRTRRHLTTTAPLSAAQSPRDGQPGPTSALPPLSHPPLPDDRENGDDGDEGDGGGARPAVGSMRGALMMVRALDPSTKHQLGVLGAGLAVISLGYGMVIPALPQFAAVWGVRHFPSQFFTVLTVLSWICVGMHGCGALPSPVLA